MTDLAARLREVIEERLRVAREAMGACWHVDYCDDGGLSIFHDTHDPADAILAGERDLAVLERHDRAWSASSRHCMTCRRDGQRDNYGQTLVEWVEWPCIEIRELAKRYGIEVE